MEYCRTECNIAAMKSKKVEYKSIKIREDHYELVKKNKEDTGVNIDFFVGKAIEEKIKREKSKK